MCGPQEIEFPLSPAVYPQMPGTKWLTLASRFCSHVSFFFYINLIILAKKMEYLCDVVSLSPIQKFQNPDSMMSAAPSFSILLGSNMSLFQ